MAEPLKRRAATNQARAVGVLGDRRLRMRWTDETFDDYETVLLIEGWDFSRFAKNSPFLWSHNWGAPPIGKVDNAQILVDSERTLRNGKTITGKAYDCDVSFSKSRNHEFSHLIYDLYLEGSLRATSAGFWPLERREPTEEEFVTYGIPFGSKYAEIWVRNKLAEISGCSIPGNENAVKSLEGQLASRGAPFQSKLNAAWLTDTFHKTREDIWLPEVFAGTLNRIMLKLEGQQVPTDWKSVDVYQLAFSRKVFGKNDKLVGDEVKAWLDDHKLEPLMGIIHTTEKSFSVELCEADEMEPDSFTTITEGMPIKGSMTTSSSP